MRPPLKRGEKDFVMVPNRFYNGWMKEVDGHEWMVLCYILRKTVGWNKAEDWIKYEDFLESLHISRRTLARCLVTLEKKEMIFKRREKYKGVLDRIFYRLNIESAGIAFKGDSDNSHECQKYTRKSSHGCQKYTRDECQKYTHQNTISTKNNKYKDSVIPLSGNNSAGGKPPAQNEVNYLQNCFFEKLKSKIENPAFNWGIAGKIMKSLLKTQSRQEIELSISRFFSTGNKFIISRGWKIEDFQQNYNAYKSGVAEKAQSGKNPKGEAGKYDGLEEH